MTEMALKAQQAPHFPWSLTGLSFPLNFQSILCTALMSKELNETENGGASTYTGP